MKIKSVKLARSIWLFDLSDLNPTGKDVAQDIFDWVKESYGFAVAPSIQALAAKKASGADGACFENGHFQVREEVFVEISKLTVYNDGVVIDTPSSTTDADKFAADLLESAAREFSLAYDSETVRKRIYLSELIVSSDIPLDSFSPALVAFSRRIGEALSGSAGPQVQVAGLQFWTEPNDVGKHKSFTFERQVGKAFDEHRYYSQAPLQTDKHFALLKELEQALKKS